MVGDTTVEQFSLLGGPFTRLGTRLGLIRRNANSVPLGIALGFTLWIIMMLLALIEGTSAELLSLDVLGVHARLLAALPLMFLCETVLNPRVTTFIRMIVHSGVIPEESLPALKVELQRIERWKDSWLPDTLAFVAAVGLSLLAPSMQLTGITIATDPTLSATSGTWATQWYLLVGLTVFRFVLFRWFWRFGLWCFLLWRLSRLRLNLVPTHPDTAGGLGYLEVVQLHFAPLVLSISVVQAASLAEEISIGVSTINTAYSVVVFILALDVALFIGPLYLFADELWSCRVKALNDYMEFASNYVNRFDEKWLRTSAPPRNLLGTPDLQSLADLSSSLQVIKDIRLAPVSLRFLNQLAVAALAPMLPLLLLEYPISELAATFVARLTGL